MTGLVNRIRLPASVTEQYKNAGAIKIEGVLTANALSGIEKLLKESDGRETATVNGNHIFSRALYDVGNKHPVTKDLCDSVELKNLINQLFLNRFYFTQGIYFELEKNKSPGLQWHFGRLSFNYIMPYDVGFTIWIPLDEIDPTRQGGGLAYIPENEYSAREDYKKAALLYEYTEKGKIDKSFAESVRPGALPDLFDAAAREESFKPGDVFLFNKFIWHKSVPLREGPLTKRRAFVMRFVSNQARYNEKFLSLTEFMGLGEYSRYGRMYSDLKHGDLLCESEFAGEPI